MRAYTNKMRMTTTITQQSYWGSPPLSDNAQPGWSLERSLPPPPRQDNPLKDLRKQIGVSLNKCQLTSFMKTAENTGGKDLWDSLLPLSQCRTDLWQCLPQSSFSLALMVCWSSSNERWSWKHKFHCFAAKIKNCSQIPSKALWNNSFFNLLGLGVFTECMEAKLQIYLGVTSNPHPMTGAQKIPCSILLYLIPADNKGLLSLCHWRAGNRSLLLKKNVSIDTPAAKGGIRRISILYCMWGKRSDKGWGYFIKKFPWRVEITNVVMTSEQQSLI